MWKAEAYDDGKRAYAHGESHLANPWEHAKNPNHPEHDLYSEWLNGWEDEQDADDNP